MHRLLFAVGIVFAAPVALLAQNAYTPVTASQIKSGGVVIASGSVTITLTDSTDKSAAAFVTADGSLNGPQGFTAAITNGAISGLNVPDMCTATNTIPNHPLSALVTITRSVSSTTSNGYSFEIPAGSTAMCGSNPFALDHYSPAQTAAIAPTGLMAATTVPAHCTAPLKLYTPTNPVVNYDCVGGVMVPETSSGGSSNVAMATGAGQVPVSPGANLPYAPQALGAVALLPTVAAVNCALNGQNGIYYAACYTGADAGAQIKSADTAAPANSVIVASGVLASNTVTTPPSVSANHMLDLQVPLTWSMSPTMANNSRITSTTGALQTISSTGNWITATSLSALEVDHLNVTWTTLVGADDGNKLLKGLGVNHVKVHDNVTTNGGWIETTSTPDTLGANQRTVYTATTVGTNTSNDVQVFNNTANGAGPCSNPSDFSQNCGNSSYNAYAAFLKFTTGVSYGNNHCAGVNTCIFTWGGNNNATTDNPPGDWTSMAESTLKATDVQGSDTNCSNVQACEVFSMTDRVISSGAICYGANDVCEDPEGSQNVQIVNFDLRGSKNGELSSFAHGANLIFGPGKVDHTSEVSWFSDAPSIPKSYSLYLRNGYNTPTYMNQVLVTGVNFQCHRPDGLVCYGITWDTGYGIKFTNDTFTDTPVFSGMTTSGELPAVEFTGDHFNLDIANATSQQNPTGSSNPAYYALDISSHYLDHSVVQNNAFTNTASQYGASAAVYKGDNFNNSYNGETDALDLLGNAFQNWGIDAILSYASGASAQSFTPLYHSALNRLGNGAFLVAANGIPTDYWIEEKEAKDRGTQALTSGTATVTLNGYYLVPPICTANDATATAPARCSVSVSNGTATLTLTGTGTDVISYSVQRKN